MSSLLSRETLQSNSIMMVTSALGLAFVAWSGTHTYVMFCAPSGIMGFIQSLVTMDSSPCQALFSVINHSQTLYSATVGALLVGIISFLGSFCARPNVQIPPKRPLTP
jgi:hypothetical protein